MPYRSSIQLKPNLLLFANPNILWQQVKKICHQGECTWRLYAGFQAYTLTLISESMPDFALFNSTWLLTKDAQPTIEDCAPLLDKLRVGARFRLTVKGNPTKYLRVDGVGKRVGLKETNECAEWLKRQGKPNGFFVSEVLVCDSRRFSFVAEQTGKNTGKKYNRITFVSVCFAANIVITDVDAFRRAFVSGIGREKAYGQGLLAIAAL